MVISGWKAIAAHLNCGVRTAQRWAQSSGLPVHRPLGRQHGQVVAFTADLEAWLRRYQEPKEKHSHVVLLSRNAELLDALKKNLQEQRELLAALKDNAKKRGYF